MKADTLSQFLPEAMDGWTREVNTEMSQALGMMGGGIGAEAEYSSGSDYFTITIMADNPMVTAMAGMLGNAAMITATGGKLVRVGREKFMAKDGEVQGMVGNRVLVQGSGDNQDAIIEHLKTIDMRGLSNFGS